MGCDGIPLEKRLEDMDGRSLEGPKPVLAVAFEEECRYPWGVLCSMLEC